MAEGLVNILIWLVLGIAVVWLIRSRIRRRIRGRTPNDMVALQRELSDGAARLARENYGIDLDYSIESVHRVEEILGQLHDHYLRTKSDEGMRGLSIAFGAYIIAVIEKNLGSGVWQRNHPMMGKDTWPYEWRGATLFPYGWCQKRILDGPADDVWFKFQVNVLNHGTAA